jgi:hypothetical protein
LVKTKGQKQIAKCVLDTSVLISHLKGDDFV